MEEKKTVKKDKKEVAFNGSPLYDKLLKSLKTGLLNETIARLSDNPKLSKTEKESLISNCQRYMRGKQSYVLVNYRKVEQLLKGL